MVSSRSKRKPTFLWQGLLIVLPVAGLAVFGFFSLRQDKILAQHEATERTQAIAEDLAPGIWNELAANNNPGPSAQHAFQVDDAGQLVFPPPNAPLPLPQPFDCSQLGLDQARWWRAVQGADAATPTNGAEEACRELLASKPPDTFAAAAEFSLGLLLNQQNKNDEAAAAFASVLEKHPLATGESGLPLQPFARLKLVELDLPSSPRLPPPIALLDALCSNIVYQPSLLSPHLLQIVAQRVRTSEAKSLTQDWLRRWEDHETSRHLFQAAVAACGGASSGLPPACAFQSNGQNWWALGSRTSEHWFVCHSEPELRAIVNKVLSNTRPLPPYFGIGVDLAGKRLGTQEGGPLDLRLWRETSYAFGKGLGGVKKEYSGALATDVVGSAAQSAQGAELLKVNLFLTSPSDLFKRQRTRSFWFGSLIALSSLAAFLGLAAAWRAFYREQQVSEMKGNFVSSVSHELRAPIASVRLMAESLERGKVHDPEKQAEYFRFIGQESRRLSALIENVLDFSRIEQGRKQYEFEPTDLASLTRQTVKLMEPYATERGVKLELVIPANGTFPGSPANPDAKPATPFWQHVADGRALQQALVNLLDNSIKHSPQGATISIGLEPLAAPEPPGKNPDSATASADTGFQLWVEDQGPGIPPAEHENIFERFYRLGSELRRETQGVGIGLSIVKHIVQAHGGIVRVRSAVGEGSRFTIELPSAPLSKPSKI